ncbi:hypothetical protein DRQ36_07770 [bacterium]|nr:MAG: hypothetical protein DRQ36_07770 [bacterium]
MKIYFFVFGLFIVISAIFADFPGFDLDAVWMPPIPEGPANGSSFGRSMAIVGDVNNDGYDDLALAAELACDTASGNIAGKVYIYFGKPGILSISDTPDIILTGEENDDWFGYDVSGGDFNADGYSDIAVLAQKGNKGYIYFGGDPMDSVPDFTLIPAYGEYFRYQMQFVGDINGDTYDDLVIPIRISPDYYIFIYNGGPGADIVPDDTLTGYGYKVGFGGDIDNDGIDDLLIGDAYTADDSGKAYIFLGGDPFPTTPSVTITGERPEHDFGWNLAIIGDINSDGFDDIGIIASGPTSWIWKQCWMYLGSDTGAYEYVGYVEDTVRQLYGTAIIGAGDINFDGYDDFIVGAPGANIVDHDPGHVHIYYGGATPPESTDVFLIGEAGNDQFGLCLAAGGDMNNDSYDDLAIGAFKSHEPGYFGGKVYLHSGKMLAYGDYEPQETVTGPPARGWAGYVVASGDIDGDGMNDIAFTHELHYKSEVYLCLGEPSGADLDPDYILTDSIPKTRFGHSIDFGDFDGDGIDDLAIGIPDWDSDTEHTSNDEGEVRIYFGSDPFVPMPGFVLHGPTKNKIFGYSLAFIGDINGDGAEELLVGAPEYITGGYADSTGYAYLFFGAGDTLPDAVYKGEEAKSAFGACVCGTGDMTGDGIPDFAISAHRIHWPDAGFGKVYIYEGNPVPPDSPSVTYEDPAYKWIGRNMAAPGDVDGDGYNELLVNCRSIEWGAYGEGNGAVRLYFGGEPLSSSDYLELTAPFGCVGGYGIGVGELGDINLDGYPDFAVGAPNGIPGEWMTAGAIAVVGHTGGDRAYVYYGGSPFDTYYDLELIPPKGHEMFGYDICAAGMTSFDGSFDIVIGAPGNSMSGYETGKVYLMSSIYSPVTESHEKPTKLALVSYPNPFNSAVSLEFASSGEYRLDIFDIGGRRVAYFSDNNPGLNRIIWNGNDIHGRSLSSGVYTARLITSGTIIDRKLVLLK